MPKDTKRLNINGLLPGDKYAIQVRAVDGGDNSTWSQKYNIETIDDTAGGTRTPAPPALLEWKVDASGQFLAVWASITQNTDGTPTVVALYELGLTAGGAEVIAPHYGQTGEFQTRSFNFGHIRSMFGGTIPTTISARLRVINSAGTVSEWSESLEATLPVPNPPENVKAQPVTDGIKLKWDPPSDPIHLWGYRVYLSMTDPDVPQVESNRVYQGQATEFSYTSLSYDFDHYFKVVSISEPGLESMPVAPDPNPTRPISPYGPDDKPPLVPVLNDPTMDRSTVTAPKANVSWEINELAADNEDISGFVIRWRIVGETNWRNSYFEKNARAGVIDLPRPFSNYEFQVGAYDFVANYSAFSDSKTLIGAATPPTAVTGVSGVPRWDGIRVVWDESNESVKFGGRYEIQIRTSAPTGDVADYSTGNTFIDITGLTSLTEYFYRVRAIDSANQAGPWSTVVSSTLPAFPAANATDGVAPSVAPLNPKATGGLNYINVSWDRVSNNDAVFYEVYMDDGSPVGVTSDNFVGESSGTSLMVTSKANGDPLLQETAYYFKVRAVDGDGPGPESVEVTATLTQVLSTDLGINMAGENLLYNSSFDTDSDGNGVADYWQVVNTAPGAEPHTASLVAGRTGGFAQRIAWTGVQTVAKGVKSKDSSILKKNTEYMFSIYVRGNGGSISFASTPAMTNVAVLEAPALSTTEWRRWILRATTSTTFDADNISFVNTGNPNSNGWVEFDDAQIEAGNLASAYKTGTVSIAKLTTGKFSTADMIISTGGRIVSETYIANPTTGFLITDAGITIKSGQVDAKTLIANSTFTNNLYVGATLEMAAGGLIRSANYNPGVAGYSLSSVGLDIRTGTVAAGTLAAGTITSPNIILGAGGKITVDQTGAIVSNNYSYNAALNTGTGFKISNLGIEMWDTNSKINVNALETSTLTSTVITLGSGGIIQNANWAAGTGARWKIDDTGLVIVNGSITGSSITTDQLKSLTSETVDGVNRYRFSINAEGYAEFVGVRIYGNSVVGTSANNVIQSGNYNGSAGWRIQGNGTANFFQLNTWNQNVYGAMIIGNGGTYSIMRSNTYESQSAGWLVDSNGYAEFNGGSFRIGSASGGLLWMGDFGGGNAQVRFYRPGDTSRYGLVRNNGPHLFEIRSPTGAAIELWSPEAWDGHSLVRLSQDAHVTQTMWIDNSLYLSGGLEMWGDLKLKSYADGSGGVRRLDVQDNGLVALGAVSSERYKNNIVPLDVSKEQVLSLNPVEFDWNPETTKGRTGRSVGVIAEQAEELGLGQFVYYLTAKDGTKTVDGFNYEGFTSALLMVAREQQTEIEDLKSQMDRLEVLVRLALDK